MWCGVFGVLGRQGSPNGLTHMTSNECRLPAGGTTGAGPRVLGFPYLYFSVKLIGLPYCMIAEFQERMFQKAKAEAVAL